MSVRTLLRGTGIALVLALVLAFTLIPIVWIVLTSFKPEDQWVSDPPAWIPSDWSFTSYTQMWSDGADVR